LIDTFGESSFGNSIFASFICLFLKPGAPTGTSAFGWKELMHCKLVRPVASSSLWLHFDLARICEETDPKLLQMWGQLLQNHQQECVLFDALRTHPKFRIK